MSEEKTALDKISEKIAEVTAFFKEKFDGVEAPVTEQEEEAQFADVTLLDGETVLSIEGELAEGSKVFVQADGEQIPAPEGTHQLGGDLEGVSIVVDAEGSIVEVIDERENSEEAEVPAEAEEAMSKEDIEEVVNGKVNELGKVFGTLLEVANALKEENEVLKNEINEFKSEFNKFKDEPQTTKKENKKFSRVELTPAERRTQMLIKDRQKRS